MLYQTLRVVAWTALFAPSIPSSAIAEGGVIGKKHSLPSAIRSGELDRQQQIELELVRKLVPGHARIDENFSKLREVTKAQGPYMSTVLGLQHILREHAKIPPPRPTSEPLEKAVLRWLPQIFDDPTFPSDFLLPQYRNSSGQDQPLMYRQDLRRQFFADLRSESSAVRACAVVGLAHLLPPRPETHEMTSFIDDLSAYRVRPLKALSAEARLRTKLWTVLKEKISRLPTNSPQAKAWFRAETIPRGAASKSSLRPELDTGKDGRAIPPSPTSASPVPVEVSKPRRVPPPEPADPVEKRKKEKEPEPAPAKEPGEAKEVAEEPKLLGLHYTVSEALSSGSLRGPQKKELELVGNLAFINFLARSPGQAAAKNESIDRLRELTKTRPPFLTTVLGIIEILHRYEAVRSLAVFRSYLDLKGLRDCETQLVRYLLEIVALTETLDRSFIFEQYNKRNGDTAPDYFRQDLRRKFIDLLESASPAERVAALIGLKIVIPPRIAMKEFLTTADTLAVYRSRVTPTPDELNVAHSILEKFEEMAPGASLVRGSQFELALTRVQTAFAADRQPPPKPDDTPGEAAADTSSHGLFRRAQIAADREENVPTRDEFLSEIETRVREKEFRDTDAMLALLPMLRADEPWAEGRKRVATLIAQNWKRVEELEPAKAPDVVRQLVDICLDLLSGGIKP